VEPGETLPWTGAPNGGRVGGFRIERNGELEDFDGGDLEGFYWDLGPNILGKTSKSSG